jgi:large subunit ribosomal protein L30
MKKVIITQIKSRIRTLPNQRASLDALGLLRIRHSVEKELTPQIQGMLRVVNHLVEVKEA